MQKANEETELISIKRQKNFKWHWAEHNGTKHFTCLHTLRWTDVSYSSLMVRNH